MAPRRRLVIPEVVQTSAMDCGPASLKCLLEGFGVPVSYGRLREACQTDVDGTSIDTLEEVANQLGLRAEQMMLPADHLLLPETDILPAIVVVRLPNGFTHFVVVWRRHGDWVQVMDPARGRRWLRVRAFLDELYIHTLAVPAAGWREWAGSDDALRPLGRRLRDLGLSAGEVDGHLSRATSDPGWTSLAALDAAARVVAAIVASGSVARGRQAAALVAAFDAEARRDAEGESPSLPAGLWSVRPAPAGADGAAMLDLRGAVLLRVAGVAPLEGDAAGRLSPELAAALKERPVPPLRRLIALVREDGVLAPAMVAGALFLAAAGVLVEALLLRGAFDLARTLGLPEQRLGGLAALATFALALLLLEVPIAAEVLRLGRHLEGRLRAAFLDKIPRLSDRYFQSRPVSDMAERSHALHAIRTLPELGGRLLRASFDLLLTTAGIAWLEPAAAPFAVGGVALVLGASLAVQPLMAEQDMRYRTHLGSLSSFYLDALLGLVAVRTHRAERTVRRAHEGLLVDWVGAGYALQRTAVLLDGALALVGSAVAAALLYAHATRGGDLGATLLLVYWALKLPASAQDVAACVQQYPGQRNLLLRLMEPLGAPEEATPDPRAIPAAGRPGVAVVFEGVRVLAAGHVILDGLSFAVAPGEHVAIVGPSGAGKSSLVGLLLGWHRAAAGRILVDGELLDHARLDALRAETAWVDPAVHLWNRSFLENLAYGAPPPEPARIGQAVEQAGLRRVLEKLPEGLQTPLGEGGGLLSGGEGQRVRLARGLMRADARLVILDEPFRGLDREARRALLARARGLWPAATLVCITHDVGDTRVFPRVLVVEGGRLVEDGAPDVLAAQPGTRYAALLEAEAQVRTGLWSSAAWRRLRLEGGRLREGA